MDQAKVEKSGIWSPHNPLWGNPRLPHFESIPDPVVWARFGIKTLEDVVSNGRLFSCGDLKHAHDLPNHMLFRYLQL